MVKLNIMSGDKVLSALDTEAVAEPPKEPEKVIAVLVDGDYYPTEAGWYPVFLCWDPQEGFFPDACQWDGKQWLPCGPVSHVVAERFDTKDAAEKRARELDPEW